MLVQENQQRPTEIELNREVFLIEIFKSTYRGSGTHGDFNMTTAQKELMNTVGLALAALGSFLLTRFNKGFILVNADGSLRLGPADGVSNEDFRATNRTYLRNQKIMVPLAYWSMTIGFGLQFAARL